MRQPKLLSLVAALACSAGMTLPALAVTSQQTLTVSAARSVAATVNISQNNFTWAAVNDTTNQFLPSDSNANIVSGQIVTSGTTGSGTVGVLAPASIVGTNTANILPISALSITCSTSTGSGTTPTFAAVHTPLVASTTTVCATWGAGANAPAYSFTLSMYLDDRTFVADRYTSALFAVVASAL